MVLPVAGGVTDCGWHALVAAGGGGSLATAGHKFGDARAMDCQRFFFGNGAELCGQRPEFPSDRPGSGNSTRATIGGDPGKIHGGRVVAVAVNSSGGDFPECCHGRLSIGQFGQNRGGTNRGKI